MYRKCNVAQKYSIKGCCLDICKGYFVLSDNNSIYTGRSDNNAIYKEKDVIKHSSFRVCIGFSYR